MAFITSFYEHLRFFTAAANAENGTGELRIGSMHMRLRKGDSHVDLLAQFMNRSADGSVTYSMRYSHDAAGFIGWLPYFNKRWIEAHDKLAFKRRCASANLPTPPWLDDCGTQIDSADFVLKQAEHSSFGYGVRGPFEAATLADMTPLPGHYIEHYIPGQIGKAWFWNDRVAAIELEEFPSVVGDGHATLAQLVRRVRRSANVEQRTDFFRFHDLHWDRVPEDGERVVLDFKYMSPLAPYDDRSRNRMQELRDAPVVSQLDAFGPVFWSWVPADIRQGVLYTVDFVLARDERLWLLEMNCNPMVPPECYDTIVGAALRGEVSGTESVKKVMLENAVAGTTPAFDVPSIVVPQAPPVPPPPIAPPAITTIAPQLSASPSSSSRAA